MEENDESSEGEMRVEETDDILVNKGNSSNALGESILFDLKQDEYSWVFEDVLSTMPLKDGQKIVDVDSIEDRLFIMLSDLTLIQISLMTKKVISETKISAGWRFPPKSMLIN